MNHAENLQELCHRLDTENTATDPQKCADTMDEARLAILSLIAALEAAQGERDAMTKACGEALKLSATLSEERVKDGAAPSAKDAEIERLRKALKPFATAANFYEIESQTFEETQILVKKGEGFSSALQVKDFRQARALLSKQDSGKAQP